MRSCPLGYNSLNSMVMAGPSRSDAALDRRGLTEGVAGPPDRSEMRSCPLGYNSPNSMVMAGPSRSEAQPVGHHFRFARFTEVCSWPPKHVANAQLSPTTIHEHQTPNTEYRIPKHRTPNTQRRTATPPPPRRFPSRPREADTPRSDRTGRTEAKDPVAPADAAPDTAELLAPMRLGGGAGS
jgi:hypothetical protein